ncbi:MAG: hypothetical protein A2341_08955 [Deltaproteobacteria bacterium RIFOXYB12_FULL_58_9]|nr:MAG: hypothetical protein A2341_08955 [Deltaproteobacteria bacterium RIFOXYB12_FULL_58_9]
MRKLRRLLKNLLARPDVRRILAGSTMATGVLIATSAMASGGPPADAHVNWWTWSQHAPPVGWFMVNFVIFIVLMVALSKKKIKEAFAQRHVTIKHAIQEAAAAHAKATGKYEEYKGKLANVDDEAAMFIKSGKEDGALERDQIIVTAKDYAGRLLSDSSAVVDQEFEKAQRRLRREVAAEVLKLTEDALRSQLNDKDRARLIDEAISELERGTTVDKVVKKSKPTSNRPTAGGAL